MVKETRMWSPQYMAKIHSLTVTFIPENDDNDHGDNEDKYIIKQITGAKDTFFQSEATSSELNGKTLNIGNISIKWDAHYYCYQSKCLWSLRTMPLVKKKK